MTRSQQAIIHALLGTGLICYVHAIAFGLGASSLGIISPFFYSIDLFADFFKHIGSFPSGANMRIETWLPGRWQDIIHTYLVNSPVKTDAAYADSAVTHYHWPPLAISISTIYGHLCTYIGPATIFVLSLLAITAWLYACVRLSGNKKLISSLAFTFGCLLIYPSIYAILRGHIWAYITALSACTSFLLALRRPSRPWLAALLMAISINIRPNIITLLPLLYLTFPRHRRGKRLAVIIVGCSAFILAASLIAARLLHPGWTPVVFLRAYSYYSKIYEIQGDTFHHLLAELSKSFFRKAGFPGAEISTAFFRYLLISSGLCICLYSYFLLARKKAGLPRSLLVCIAGMIVATPAFGAYHLLIVLTPLLCNQYLEVNVQKESPVAYSATMCNELLQKSDFIFAVILLLPKAFPIWKTFGLYVIVNFLAIVSYVTYVYLTNQNRPIRLREETGLTASRLD